MFGGGFYYKHKDDEIRSNQGLKRKNPGVSSGGRSINQWLAALASCCGF